MTQQGELLAQKWIQKNLQLIGMNYSPGILVLIFYDYFRFEARSINALKQKILKQEREKNLTD
jgi:hypothetical protein